MHCKVVITDDDFLLSILSSSKASVRDFLSGNEKDIFFSVLQ